MSKTINVYPNGLPIMNQALVQIDMDVDAERLVIQDRNTMEQLYYGSRPTMGISKVIVPMRYATSNSLLVGILDVSEVYNCNFTDSVRAEIVDAYSVDMSQ